MTTPRHIVITGLMGSGKTTLGRALADRLGRKFVDSDEALEARQGRTARAIADREGLDRLHELEAASLIEALTDDAPSVIAAAASTVEDPDARRALGAPDVFVIWLRGSPALLADRATRGTHRPLDDSAPLAMLTEQADRRNPLYAAVADVTIEIDDRPPVDVVAAARDAIRNPVPRS